MEIGSRYRDQIVDHCLVIVKSLILITTLSLGSTPSIQAQSQTVISGDKHIAIVNNRNNNTIKQLYVGDKVRLRLVNSLKVIGTIMSIDSTHFIVSNQHVHFDEIKKISTRKGWVRGLGGAVAGMGILALSYAATPDEQIRAWNWLATGEPEDNSGDFLIPGLIMTGAGVAMVLPNYHKIGKYSLTVIPGY